VLEKKREREREREEKEEKEGKNDTEKRASERFSFFLPLVATFA